jgi:DNA-binding NarL/FixJ family response regulator
VITQIFLCYARLDQRKVDALYDKLSDLGFKPWMDKRDILPGEIWEAAIQKAIRRSDFFLACLSVNSVNRRGQIQKEIKKALDIWEEKLDSDIYLIPVRLEDCEVPESLHRFQWVNLFEEDGWTRLVEALRAGAECRTQVTEPAVQKSTGAESRSTPEEPSPGTTKKTISWEGPERVQIRILLADDQAISREGIRRIIERESDMTIVGVVQTAPEVLPQVREKKPDVVLLDLKWHGDDRAMDDVIAQIRRDHPKTRVIGMTVYAHLVQQARAAGATWVMSKDISKNELLRIIRAVYASTVEAIGPKELKEARLALEQLRSLKTGKQYAAHEEVVRVILMTVLHPHLTNPRSQISTISGSRRRDILFSNYSSLPFWQRVSQRHDATQIVFEVKNVKRLDVRYVDQVAGYLTPGLGRLGFLVSRSPAGAPMVQRAVEVFQTDRKVVLFLCDHDLEDMLKLKERGDDATELIRQRYDDFTALT